MPAFLFTIGALLCVVGLFLIGFFIPNRDFSVGSTGILAGAIAIIGGLILVGLAAVLRELRKMTKQLEKPTQLARPVPAPAAARAPVSPPMRAMPKPAAAPVARGPQRAEPRLDIPAPDEGPPEPLSPAAPTIADVTADRPRAGLFASIRGRSPPPPRADVVPPMPAAPRGGIVEPPPFDHGHDETGADAGPAPRSPSLSALAARTAARLDLPRPVPDLPRAAPEPPGFDHPLPEREPEKPARNLFDTVWPTGAKPPAERSPESDRNGSPGRNSDRHEDMTAAGSSENRPAEILKSGVIDGMAYTLYTDGSIEAQLPQGTLRFGSIDDLRAHLERQH